MPVQQIELEEVTMMEASDNALEVSGGGAAAATYSLPTLAWPC